MALKKCKECGVQASTKAEKCPGCGAPVKSKGIGCGGSLIIIICLFIFIGIINDNSKSRSSQTSQPPTKIVSNSPWDGSVRQVERWLKNNLKDPESFDAMEWSPVQEVNLATHKFIVRCKYRAKNSFGGYVVENKIFHLDANGSVVNVIEL